MKKTLSRSWKLFWIVWAIIATINIVAAYLWIGFPDADMGIAAGVSYSISSPLVPLVDFFCTHGSCDEDGIFSLIVIFSALFLCPALWAGMIVGAVRGGEKILEVKKK